MTENTSKPIIKLGSFPPGSGKSRSAFEYAIASDEPIIITTPTDTLSLQYDGHFEANDKRVTTISRKLNKDVSSHQKFKDSCHSGAKRILLNRDVFYDTDAKHFENYRIVQDEFHEPLKVHTFKKAQHIRDTLLSFIDIDTTVSTRYYKLLPSIVAWDIAEHGWDRAGIQNMETVIDLCKRNISPHYDVFVLADSYTAFEAGKINDIQFWSVMKPTIYGSSTPTLIGANAEDRLFYHLWKDQVDFQKADFINGDYETLTEQAKRGRILYVSNKKLTGEEIGRITHRELFDRADDAIKRNFPEKQYIFGINKDRYGRDIAWNAEGSTGTRVQLVSHGQNAFKHIDMAVYLAAQFYDPATYKFVEEVFGITGDELTRDTYDRMFQFLMRCSARDKDCEREFVWIVPDIHSAQYLQEKMPVAKLEFLDIGIPGLNEENTMNQTPEDRRRINTENKAKKRETERMIKEGHENTTQYDNFKVIVWANKYAQELVTHDLSWFDLGALFRQDHETYNPKNKSAARCFREGLLADVSNHKLVSNLQSTRLILMDMDIVKRDPQDLSDYFARQNISHYIFNSYSSTPLEPRIRVAIGLSEAVNPANYIRIMNLLQADIDAAFGKGTYVIDGSKFTVNTKFHSPSVPQFKSSIFIEKQCGMNGFKVEAAFLDVRWFLSRNIPISKIETISPRSSEARLAPVKEAVEDILDRWSVAPGQGLGSFNFHQAVVDLKKAGLSREDAIQIMTANRHRFGDGVDRDAVYTVGRVYDARSSFIKLPSDSRLQLAV